MESASALRPLDTSVYSLKSPFMPKPMNRRSSEHISAPAKPRREKVQKFPPRRGGRRGEVEENGEIMSVRVIFPERGGFSSHFCEQCGPKKNPMEEKTMEDKNRTTKKEEEVPLTMEEVEEDAS